MTTHKTRDIHSDTNADLNDDRPRVSHTKTLIQITNQHRSNLGTWQSALATAWLSLVRFLMAPLAGIYLTEFRHVPHIYSEVNRHNPVSVTGSYCRSHNFVSSRLYPQHFPRVEMRWRTNHGRAPGRLPIRESAFEHSSNDYIGYLISILKLVVRRILAHPSRVSNWKKSIFVFFFVPCLVCPTA